MLDTVQTDSSSVSDRASSCSICDSGVVLQDLVRGRTGIVAHMLSLPVGAIVLKPVVESYAVLGAGANQITALLVHTGLDALLESLAWLERRALCSRPSDCRFARPDEEVLQGNHPVRFVTRPDPVLRGGICASKAVDVFQHLKVFGKRG
jgi:hypothetical protein